MTQVSLSTLKANIGKYVMLAQEQDILITKNGKVVAKLGTAKVDKKEALSSLLHRFEGKTYSDEDIAKARKERLSC